MTTPTTPSRIRRDLRRIVRPADAADMLGVSRMTLYRLEERGAIPPRVRVTDHVVGWYERDLAAYLESRQTVRETGPCRRPPPMTPERRAELREQRRAERDAGAACRA